MDNNQEGPRTPSGIYLPEGSEIAQQMATQEVKPINSSDGPRTPGGIYLPEGSKIAQEMSAPENNEWVSPGSSQNEIDITKYKESIHPPIKTVSENAEKGLDTPSFVTVKEKKHKTPNEDKVAETKTEIQDTSKPTPPIPPLKDNTPYDLESGSGYDPAPKKPFDLEFGSDEEKPFDLEFGDDSLPEEPIKQDSKSETTPPIKSEDGEDKKPKIEVEISEILKEKHILEIKLEETININIELKARLDSLEIMLKNFTQKYDNPEDLQNALDPNRQRLLNPLEQVQATLLPEQIKQQQDFAKAVEQERIAYDPTYGKTPEVVPVTPQETDPNQQRKERNWKRAALIAGVVAGGTTGIVGGVPAAGIGALACIGAGVINKGVDFIGSRRINKLTEQLKTTTDPETRAKLEKRIKNWEKARKGTEYVKSFLTGAKLGLLGSSIFSGVFMGGHGLVWNQAEIPTGIPTGHTDASGSLGNNPTVETAPPVDQSAPLVDGNIPTPEVPTETYDLFANGRLNLPGSAMDGWRLADIPQGYENVPLENIPDNLFANSASKYFHMFIRDAGAAGYSNAQVSEAISKMGPQVAHRILRDGAYSGQNILQTMIDGGWLPTK